MFHDITAIHMTMGVGGIMIFCRKNCVEKKCDNTSPIAHFIHCISIVYPHSPTRWQSGLVFQIRLEILRHHLTKFKPGLRQWAGSPEPPDLTDR